MEAALRFRGITKRFGAHTALDGLSFSIPRGTITGFVGPNGAGKTTTFSVVSGFLEQDQGEIELLGLPAFDPIALKGRLGVLPQDAELPDRFTPIELLVHLAQLQGMSRDAARQEAERVVTLVRLADRAKTRIAKLSHGMRKRVAVASALLGEPELVLLDEPMAGLDPLQARSLRDALAASRGARTLVVSSHNLDELERLCDYVVMVDRGRCLREGPIDVVTGRSAWAAWTLGAPPPLDALRAGLDGFEVQAEGAELSLRAPAGADMDAASVTVMQILAAAQIPVREVRRGRALEAQFFEDAARDG